ncbi:4Fe-4S binding protein [Methanobrevibacter sp. DSM 116169]|uniref:4Fe-4S binding protein n=1 Tax=Methanobrevibacter sp. DSM 116169 TaxID=3242727 RepID=UPI0038FBFFE1
MKVSFKKQMKKLEREVLLKSADLDDDIEDFKFEVESFNSKDNTISISPICVRCNLCYEVCPVDAIDPSNIFKQANIKDNCVKCEICVQSCPISCINSINASSIIEPNQKEIGIDYFLNKKNIPHRTIRLRDISIELKGCTSCGHCTEYCPTGAITLKPTSFFKDLDDDIVLDDEKLYPTINKKICIGCGSCANLCPEDIIDLERFTGPIINTKELILNQDICVNCYLCEDNCPVEAIKLKDGKVIIDRDKCIRCNTCSDRCPVGALKIVDLDKEEFDES